MGFDSPVGGRHFANLNCDVKSEVLQVSDLRYYFGGTVAVDGASLTANEKDITGLIGPNGAGKTTTFNCIAGLLKPSDGEVLLHGRKITGCSPDKVFREYHVHRTFQIPRPLGSMTVLENLMLPYRKQLGERLYGLFTPHKVRHEEEARAERALESLRLVGLELQAKVPASNLSGGQRKLLEIGRALIDRPLLLLLDEPTAGVNPSLAGEICERLRAIVSETGVTILMISHDMASVKRLCDKVIVMVNGKILMSGLFDEVVSSTAVQEAYLGH